MGNQTDFQLGLHPWSEPLVKRLLGLSRAETLYSGLRESLRPGEGPVEFCRKALALLGVSFELPQEQLLALRKVEGPVLFVANHPFGAIDALVMMVLMGEIRPEFKFVGNALLDVLPELGPALLPVHIMGETANPGANFAAVRKILRYLEGGGMIGMFPAGQVAAFDFWGSRETAELTWTPHLGRLVKKSRATVVPLFFSGRNSGIFQYLGLALPDFRIALLVREMLHHRSVVRFRLGTPIPYADDAANEDAESHSLRLRRRTFGLRHQSN